MLAIQEIRALTNSVTLFNTIHLNFNLILKQKAVTTIHIEHPLPFFIVDTFYSSGDDCLKVRKEAFSNKKCFSVSLRWILDDSVREADRQIST